MEVAGEPRVRSSHVGSTGPPTTGTTSARCPAVEPLPRQSRLVKWIV